MVAAFRDTFTRGGVVFWLFLFLVISEVEADEAYEWYHHTGEGDEGDWISSYM